MRVPQLRPIEYAYSSSYASLKGKCRKKILGNLLLFKDICFISSFMTFVTIRRLEPNTKLIKLKRKGKWSANRYIELVLEFRFALYHLGLRSSGSLY